MAKKKGKRKGITIEMYGMSDLLQKIEKAGGNVDAAVQKAVDNSLAVVGKEMQTFMAGHKQTGDTYESYEQTVAKIKNNKVQANVGYKVKKGGLPAIFLDVGTPKQKPYFYRYHAVENSREQIAQIQRNTLNEILEGLK